MWMWCIGKNITLVAEHLPGHLSVIADQESRSMRDRCDWMLNPKVFQTIQDAMGPLEVDLFATRLTKQLPRFYSWRPDPEAVATDAFLQDWSQLRGFANPPWYLIHRCLTKVKVQSAQMVLITPFWKTQSWFPMVLEMLEDYPRALPTQSDLVVMPTGQEFLIREGVPPLIAWPISGNPIHHKDFLMRHQSSCSLHGEIKLTPIMDHPLLSGLIGVSNGRDPHTGPIADVANFLSYLFSQGYQYQSLNCYRSAISSVHDPVDGVSVGSHPTITRLMKGAFNTRPPLPRYSAFWDVGTVITYLKALGENGNLSLRQLTLKTTMLLALTRPSRSADLSSLDIQWRSYQSEGVTFRPIHLAKQSRSSKQRTDFFSQPLKKTLECVQ